MPGKDKEHRVDKTETGAGDGNRTHTSSLGSYSSTIELRPRSVRILAKSTTVGMRPVATQ